MVLSIIGIIIAIVVFIIGVYKGLTSYWVAFVAALIVALTSQMSPMEVMITGENSFLNGMINFIPTVFACIFGGTILGSVYNVSGAATRIAKTLTRLIPVQKGNDKKTARIAVGVIIAINGIFMFGGIDAFSCTFVLIPIIISTFAACDIPKKFIPAMQILCWPFLCMPGCPQIFNIVASAAITNAGYAVGPAGGLIPGMVGSCCGLVISWYALSTMIIKAKEKGEHFEWGSLQNRETTKKKDNPGFILSLLPIILVFVLYNTFKVDILWTLLAAVVLALILFVRNIDDEDLQGNRINLFRRITNPISAGVMNLPGALFTVITPSGLATVIIGTAAFGAILTGVSSLNIHILILTFVFTCIIVALTSAPPVALNVCIPIIAALAAEQLGADQVPAAAIMRIAVVCVMTFETLPFGGQVVLSIGLAGETHKTAYKPILITTVLVPLLSAAIVTAMFMAVPTFI